MAGDDLDGVLPCQQSNQEDWDDDPAIQEERQFWFDAGFREVPARVAIAEIERMAGPGAQARAARDVKQAQIDHERFALAKDVAAVRAAPEAKRAEAIKAARWRWAERDDRAQEEMRAIRLVVATACKAAPEVAAVALLVTGEPGRPTSRHLIEAEFVRRAGAGAVLPTLAAEARALASWVREVHSLYPQPTPRTVENRIRAAFRAHKTPPPM